MNIYDKIQKLKKDKKAVILAHYYQNDEIQDIADFVEDSLGLSQRAAETDAEIIVFAGVKFMAETAKILNPGKKVLLTDMNAGCSLADSCKYDDFKSFIEKHPDHKVITYINCTAEIKTLSDIICTSSNAVSIVNSFNENEKLIFAPDKNLGAYINSITGRNMLLWDGSCEVHDNIKIESIIKLKAENQDAKLIAHPECKQAILELADFIGSTTKLIEFTIKYEAKKYIIATETGILHKMKMASPNKEFLIVPGEKSCNCNDCEYMKLTTLEKIYNCLDKEENEIVLSEEIMNKAKTPIIRMLNLSK
jgi:quinolinate synthase